MFDNILAPDQSWGRFAAVSAKEFGELVCSLHPWILFPGPPPHVPCAHGAMCRKFWRSGSQKGQKSWMIHCSWAKEQQSLGLSLFCWGTYNKFQPGIEDEVQQTHQGVLGPFVAVFVFPNSFEKHSEVQRPDVWWPVSISRVLKYDWGCPSFWVQLMKMEANYLHRKLSTMSSPWFLLALTLGPGPGCAAGPVWWSGADLLTNWDTKHPVLAIITCQQKPMISATCVVNPYDIQHRILILVQVLVVFLAEGEVPKKMEQSQPKSDGVIHFGCSIHTQIATFQIDEFLEFIVSSLYPFIRIIYAQNDDNYFHSRWCTIVS